MPSDPVDPHSHDPRDRDSHGPSVESGADRLPGATEYLAAGAVPISADAPPRSRGRRGVLLAAVAVGVAGTMAVGGWAAMSLMAGGGQPAEAIPASAVGYASIDLDPSAGQKVEAFRMLRKFPAIEEELGLDVKDDLRRLIFDHSDLAACDGLDYAAEVEPWLGDRAAFAVLPGAEADTEPVPLVALQVTDEDAAAKGLERVAGCEGVDGELGYAFTGGYALLSDSTEHAEQAAADAEEGDLAGDPTFQRWTDELGDPGIVSMYAAPGAPEVFAHLQDAVLEEGVPGALEVEPMAAGLGGGGMDERLQQLAEDFKGAAAVVRFDDGTLETELVAEGLPSELGMEAGGTTAAHALPADTGLALSIGLAEGWVDELLTALSGSMGGLSVDDLVAEAEAETGLSLPEDLESLLGEGVSIAVDAGVDVDALLESEDPSALPVGVRIQGDPDEILAVVDKLKAKIGPDAQMLVSARGDGVVALALSQEYVDTLAAEGTLGEQDAFRAVVPDAERASGLLFVDFDAGDGWLEKAADGLGSMFGGSPDPAVRENLKPLRAFGASGWTEGDVQHGLLRLTTE